MYQLVLRGSVVKSLTCNPGILGLSRTGSSEFFLVVSLGKTLQNPSLVLVKDMNNVSCHRDMTENSVESGVKHHSVMIITIITIIKQIQNIGLDFPGLALTFKDRPTPTFFLNSPFQL